MKCLITAMSLAVVLTTDPASGRSEREPGFDYPVPAERHTPRPQRPEQYVVHRAVDAIAVDGRLDERSWDLAAWTVDFGHILSAEAYATPPVRTRARLLWDDVHLYAAVELQEPHLVAHIADDDAEIYDDNDIEMFLDVDGDAQDYIELEFNCLGTVWDMLLPKEYNRGGVPFSHPQVDYSRPWDLAGLRAAVRVDGSINYPYDTDVGWVIELSLPWTSLAATDRSDAPLARDGRTLRVNFSRVQHPWPRDVWPISDWSRAGPVWDWTWSPLWVYNLHAVEGWGRLILADRSVDQGPDPEWIDPFAFVAPPSAAAPPVPRDMVKIDGGTYRIGPDVTDPDASPAGTVTIADFYIDRCEVTVSEYVRFLNAGDHDRYYHEDMADPDLCGIYRSDGAFAVVPGKADYPVVFVDQSGAAAFADWAGKRLPTEFEWEVAARGQAARRHPWGGQPVDDGRANFDYRVGHTTPVGSYPQGQTPEGVHDLAGNASEIVEGVWTVLPWSEVSPVSPTRGPILRGGSWGTPGGNLASTYRDAFKGSSAMAGFRCAKEMP